MQIRDRKLHKEHTAHNAVMSAYLNALLSMQQTTPYDYSLGTHPHTTAADQRQER